VSTRSQKGAPFSASFRSAVWPVANSITSELQLRRGQWARSAEISFFQGGIAERKAMIDRAHDLPITKQAEVLRISRGSVYYLPRPVPEADLAIMRRLNRLHLEFPFAGSRMLSGLLVAEGCRSDADT
jgi:hypothetical protein